MAVLAFCMIRDLCTFTVSLLSEGKDCQTRNACQWNKGDVYTQLGGYSLRIPASSTPVHETVLSGGTVTTYIPKNLVNASAKLHGWTLPLLCPYWHQWVQ